MTNTTKNINPLQGRSLHVNASNTNTFWKCHFRYLSFHIVSCCCTARRKFNTFFANSRLRLYSLIIFSVFIVVMKLHQSYTVCYCLLICLLLSYWNKGKYKCEAKAVSRKLERLVGQVEFTPITFVTCVSGVHSCNDA